LQTAWRIRTPDGPLAAVPPGVTLGFVVDQHDRIPAALGLRSDDQSQEPADLSPLSFSNLPAIARAAPMLTTTNTPG
jgi:hypothetical protein